MGKDAKLISGILSYCDLINEILSEFDGDENEFFNRSSFHLSCSFCIEQIGHSAEQIDPKIREKFSEINWDSLIRIRNGIAHFYDVQDLEIIWDFATKKVQKLRKVCERILYELTKR